MERPIKTTKIDVTCGIYDAQYTIKDFGARIEVKTPYIKWVNNNGNLAYTTYLIDQPNRMAIIRNMADNDATLADVDSNCGIITLQDVICGEGENLNLTAAEEE